MRSTDASNESSSDEDELIPPPRIYQEAIEAFLEPLEENIQKLLSLSLDEDKELLMHVLLNDAYGQDAPVEDLIIFLSNIFKQKNTLLNLVETKIRENYPIVFLLKNNHVKASILFLQEMRRHTEFRKMWCPALLHKACIIGQIDLIKEIFSAYSQEKSIFTSFTHLLEFSLWDLLPVHYAIISKNRECILYLIEQCLIHFDSSKKKQVFCELGIFTIDKRNNHANFLHFLGYHKPELILEVYVLLQQHFNEPLHNCLLALDHSALKPLDFIADDMIRVKLRKEALQEFKGEKILVLDLDETIVTSIQNPKLKKLSINEDFVLKKGFPEACLRRSLIKAIILWTMLHPDIRLYIVTASDRDSEEVLDILKIITGKKQDFLLAGLNGYFCNENSQSVQYYAFLALKKLNRLLPDYRKYLQIEFLLNQDCRDLKRSKVCFYDDKKEIIEEALKKANYNLTAIQAELLSGETTCLQKVAQFCGIDQELPENFQGELKDTLLSLQELYTAALKKNYLEPAYSNENSDEDEEDLDSSDEATDSSKPINLAFH